MAWKVVCGCGKKWKFGKEGKTTYLVYLWCSAMGDEENPKASMMTCNNQFDVDMLFS